MKKKLLLIVLLTFVLTGCSSSGVPQEQYESVVAERDALKTELESLKLSKSSEETIPKETAELVEETEQENEQDENVEIVAEYTLPDGIGWYTRHFMVIKNNGKTTADISTSSLAYSGDGTMLGAADSSFYALGPNCISVLYEAFDVEGEIGKIDTTLNTTESEYYKSVIQDLSFVQNDIEQGAVFQVTNNGSEPAEFVEGYALFFSGNELVGYESEYFTNDDSVINPGETISKQLKSSKEFDRIEFYLTGRITTW